MSKTILIVDDSASLRQVVNIALSGAGYQVIEAENGQDALDKLNGQKIHLIISDFNMPIMNGLEFLRNVKQNPIYRFTPVIMLTTENQDQLIQQAKDAGAKAWMTKPFKPEQVIATVSKVIV
ncbi:response regulator [Algicola sagamiensis]|uniref:response regulator n=1 Tax=Algicola sagamiensis TaxID=163869 RepID=UPI0003A0C5D3|nr:response regulator [Algicola sagamiensis]